MDERKGKERRAWKCKGGKPGCSAGLVCVECLSIRFQKTHIVAPSPVLSPPPLATPHLTSDGFVPRLLSPKGTAITVTDTSKLRVEGFCYSSSYPADCEAGCTLTVVHFLIKGCMTIVVGSGGKGGRWGPGAGELGGGLRPRGQQCNHRKCTRRAFS